MDQLHVHISSAVLNKATAIVLGYVPDTTGDYNKMPYQDLCKVGNLTQKMPAEFNTVIFV